MQMQQTQLQDQLVRGLTHRMNNILTLFHGYLGMVLEDQNLDKSTRANLTKIKEGAQAATELMDRTHSLVRPSATVWRELNLGEFVRMLKGTFDSFRGPKTTIEIDVQDELPAVQADASRLKTAILELVRNACEATAQGGKIRIEIRAEAGSGRMDAVPTSAQQPLKWVSLSVIDSGPGIDPAVEGKIFQPFFSTKKKQNAAGLGLNVAAGFIQQLGGMLRHHSAPGRTWFQILLPARSELGI